MSKVWFITGASKGLGRSLTQAALKAGHKVAATVRNLSQLDALVAQYPEQLLPLELDVTDHARAKAGITATITRFGRIDVLVNNAGFGITGATEAYSEEQVQSQLATNLYAPIDITRLVLPYMRQQRSGRILQISSIGGRQGNPGVSIYQAAKFGLAGFSEALAKEVAPLGIFVTSIEPGGFRTEWATGSMSFAPEIPGYESTVGVMANVLRNGLFTPQGDPDKAAKVMLDLVENPEPPVHLVLGSDALAMLRQANNTRDTEMEKWAPVSLTTDHDDAGNFSESTIFKALKDKI